MEKSIKARCVVASFIAPLSTPLVFFLVIAADPREPQSGSILVLLVTTVFSYLAMILFGLPAVLTLQCLGCNTTFAYVLAGAMAGLLTGTFLGFLVPWSVPNTDYVAFAVLGALSGLVFGLIVSKAHWFEVG